jgi:transcriptional regulator with XRE-family HTH domain
MEAGYSTRIRQIRDALGLKIATFARELEIPRSTLVGWEEGKNVSIGILLRLRERFHVNLEWFLSGEGAIFLDTAHDNQENISIAENIGIMKNIGEIQNFTMIPLQNPSSGYGLNPEPAKHIEDDPDILKTFKIPLLTKEQVFHFNPAKEIPAPNAHSGDYPDYMLAPIPLRLREYGTDLRAMIVFNSFMYPLLNAGDAAIFQATGWNGDGIYVYRVSGALHISHVRFDGKDYTLTKEFKPEEGIPYHAESFEPIGRIRAVLKEL